MGIHPSAYSATCAKSFGPAAPPMRTGGHGCCTGFGHDQLGGSCTNSPSNAASSSAQRRCMASTCSRATSPPSHVDAVVFDLVGVPSEADAEHESAARQVIEARDRLRRHDRIALRDEADAGPDARRSVAAAAIVNATNGSSDRGSTRAGSVAGRWGRPPAHRDVGVLGDVQRDEPALLRCTRQLVGTHRLVRPEHRHTKVHRSTVNPCGAVSAGPSSPTTYGGARRATPAPAKPFPPSTWTTPSSASAPRTATHTCRPARSGSDDGSTTARSRSRSPSSSRWRSSSCSARSSNVRGAIAPNRPAR